MANKIGEIGKPSEESLKGASSALPEAAGGRTR